MYTRAILAIVIFILCSEAATKQATPAPAPGASPCNSTIISTNNDTAHCPCPDVFLDVPNLSVGSINLHVGKLEAQVSLSAKVGTLLVLDAGVSANIEKVNLTITGVQAQLTMEARLGTLVDIVNRTLDSLDKNPNLLTDILQAVEGLLSSVLNATSGIVTQTLVCGDGSILNRLLDSATGQILTQTNGGSILDSAFTLLSNTTNSFNQTVLLYKDPSSGNQIEVLLDALLNILSATVLG